MATSLAEQLRKLAVPQSSIYKEEKKKPSLLFDPKEAGQKDKDTFYEIGISGLRELINLYEGFRIYEDTLFSPSSKDFERAVQTKDVNDNLDKTIEKFLKQVSPYFLLQPTHKALEWLINRYHIQDYNQDAIMSLIFPYHETNIFIRFVQILDIKHPTNKWNWLRPIQKSGVPLSQQVLFNHCASCCATLKLFGKNTEEYVVEYGERASQLTTLFAFYCTTTIGTIKTSKKISESLITSILPTLIKALESPIQDFRSSAYVILGFLATKAKLKETTLNELVTKLLTSEFNLLYDMVLLTNLIYSTQTHLKKIPDDILYSISVEQMNTICLFLNKLSAQKINIKPFVTSFLCTILPLIQENHEEFRRSSNLPELMIEELDLKDQHPEDIIQCIVDAFYPQHKTSSDGNESDIEIIEEEDFYSNDIILWYSKFLKSLEHKYPQSFDEVIKKELKNKSSKKRHAQLIKVLGFNPAVSHKLGETYLFENLNHVNPELRVEAVKYIKKEFNLLKKENIEFLKESIVNRLNDDNPEVVKVALDIPTEHLNSVFTNIDLTNVFVNILSKNRKHYNKWKPVIKDAINKFCTLDVLPVNQNTVLSLMPHLIPNDKESTVIALSIINSTWGQKFKLTNKLSKLIKNNSKCDDVCKHVHKILCVDKSLDLRVWLDYNSINKESILDTTFYLLFSACTISKVSTQEIYDLLKVLLEFVEKTGHIVLIPEGNELTGKILPEVIKKGRSGNIGFPLLDYILRSIIQESKLKISKPWMNVCESIETILCRRLFEICLTGCSFEDYSKSYCQLLHKLLNKLCSNGRENMEFIANVAFGHILYAADPKDLVSPELQLRSMKLFTLGIKQSEHFILNSDVVMCMILLNLNNPLTIIRNCVMDIIETMVAIKSDKNNIYLQLLKALLEHKEELLLDHEQIYCVLNTILTQNENKIFKKNCAAKLCGVITGGCPPHISSELLKLLSQFNNASIFSQLVKAANAVKSKLKSNELNNYYHLNIYESKLLRNLIFRINENTVSSFEKNDVWDFIMFCLKQHKDVMLEEDQTSCSPSILILKQISEELFKKVPEERCNDLVKLICYAGSFSNNPNISSIAAKTMKKIHINFMQFKPILEEMLNVSDTTDNSMSKKKKTSVSMFSYQLAETDEWKLGVTLLEYLQSKKKMTVDNSFVNILFHLLNRCLRFEEQSYVEYTKQLILSSLWFYCRKFVNDKDHEQVKSLKAVFDIECIVLCIRGTQNPQTHHHALMLLSHAASMLPEQVLHHTMEIFTFMGSSVLRHDDAYSFQIINKIIETLIPILVKMDGEVENYSSVELNKLQNRVVPVLRIFADVVLHVPEHRRLPLYTKLIETLGPSEFLWIFLALLLETHMTHWNENKDKTKRANRNLADQESPINRMDFAQSLVLEFPPEVILENFIKLILYMKSLPIQKDENRMDTDVDPTDIFSINGHTAVQLRHYKYVLITFINTCLSSTLFIQHASTATDTKTMENNYKALIVNTLTFIQSISKISDDKTAKYWRVMLHHSYDLLDHTNNLLSAPMFLSVIRGLLKHTLHTVRRKSMELLNNKIQYSPEFFEDCDKELIFSLLPVLLDIIKSIDNKDNNDLNDTAAQELELNQQTALLSLKLLIRFLGTENPDIFKPVLEKITDYTCSADVAGNVMASVVLCLAELCSNLKAHALPCLRKFMPALIKVLKKQRKADTPELILLSTVTAISKIVESLPLFLSPYLQKILFEYSLLSAKWQNCNQEEAKVSAIVAKLNNIKKKIASSIPPRVLIPVVNQTHQLLLDKGSYDAIGPVMSLLAESFVNVTTADCTALQQDLTVFFLSALQLRSDASEKNVDSAVIDKAEDEIVNALVCLVLKLSENSFRPFYFKIYDWAIRTNVEGFKDRAITFYRLSSVIAEKLKGLFVLFAGHFIKNAADLLDSCNTSKSEHLYFDSEEKCCLLIEYILRTLRIVFLYDSQNFINKERFETLMQSVVDQLENTLMGLAELKNRASQYLLPCISQFAVATADDSLWKLLNYQILLKTRHNDAEIRLTALDCLVSMATQLSSSWLPLLAESVPFLAELLEDGDPKIESATKDAIRKLEQILGEPLEKYF